MSEHGEVGYLPTVTAADACFEEALGCDLGVLILGKQYGSDHHGVSVTHQEYRTLKEKLIPIITVVENEVLAFKRIFDANAGKGGKTEFPGMNEPEKTFALLDEIQKSDTNNGISEFKHLDQARIYVKLQLAHHFGSLLRKHGANPVQAEIRDILAEVRALRSELPSKGDGQEVLYFLKVSRALLDDQRKQFHVFLTHMLKDQDAAARAIVDNPTFQELLQKAGVKVVLFESGTTLQQRVDQASEGGDHPRQMNLVDRQPGALRVSGRKNR